MAKAISAISGVKKYRAKRDFAQTSEPPLIALCTAIRTLNAFAGQA